MKIKYKIINKLSLLLALVLMVACSEEKPITSEITYYPTFEITGGQTIQIELGDTFTDPGAIAYAGEGTLPVTASGSVDTDNIGVYTINYSATNADGFDGSASRTVVVVDDLDAVLSNDLSGDYLVSDWSGRPSGVVKIADGIYEIQDLIPNNKLKTIIYQVSSSQLIIPIFSSPFGTVYADPSIDASTSGVINSDGFTFNTFISCCGIFTSTFVKN